MIDTQSIRTKILDLAVRGQLTEQLPEDGTAENQYQQIQVEKQALISAGKIKKEKPTPEMGDDLPCDIPNNWKWTRLVDITTNLSLNDGDWVLSDDMDEKGTVKLIQLGSIGNLQYRDKGFKHLTQQRFEELNGKQIYPGYLLINRMVAEKMLLCIIPEIEGVLITAVDVCWIAPQDDYYNIKYLMYALASSIVQQKVKEVGYGVTRFRISKTNLISIPFPFPPLSEQKRIVEKVEEMFSVLDTIDELQTKYADNLTVLKSKLIDLAIQGKLIEQLPEDGTAEELYQQIQADKQTLIKAGKIKKEKPLPEIEKNEIPFEIPKNWCWCRLISVFSFIDYRGATPNKISEGVPFVTAKNVRQGHIDYSIAEFISEEDYQMRQSRGISHKGDLLFTTEAPMGYAAIADLDRFSAGQRLITLQQYTEIPLLENKYYMYAISAPFFQNQLDAKCSGTTVKGIKAERLKTFVIPLPPLAEQKRIVERLDQTLAVCDEMK